MIEPIINLVFYTLMLVLAFFSLLMVYALLRFGRSKVLGLIVSIFYLILMFSLYSAAMINLNNIPLNAL